MTIFIGIIIAIIVFSVIVLIHEFGHFKSARIFGVKVEEFGLGIPPKAKKIFTDKKGTKYTLNWLPLGGFVRLKGENINSFLLYDEKKNLLDNETLENFITNDKGIFNKEGNKINNEEKKEILEKLKDNSAKDSLLTKPYYQQAIIVLAGVFMNFLFAVFIFSVLFFIGIKPIGINDKIQTQADLKLIPTPEKALDIGLIKEESGVYLIPLEDSIAKNSGIKEYDLVLKVNNTQIQNYETLKNIISSSPEKEIILEISRSLDNCDITVTDNCKFENISLKITPNKEGKIGSYLIPNQKINEDFKYKYSFFESMKYGFNETYGQINLTVNGLGYLIKNIFTPEKKEDRQEAIKQVSGPIGIVDFMSKSVGNGLIFFVIISAIISVNLGVFNLLPIPALDGGRTLFIIINSLLEKTLGKKIISEKFEQIIHLGFFIFFIALSIIIAYNDVNKIINNT